VALNLEAVPSVEGVQRSADGGGSTNSDRNVVVLPIPDLMPSARVVKTIHWLWLYAGLVWCVLSGELHDYWSYVEQWKLVVAGLNPWSELPPQFGINTYGPVHNLLGIFLPIHVLAPKVFIFAVFAVASTMLLYRLLRERPDDWRALAIYILAVPGNMLITLFAFGFGTNDLLVASFVVFAILAKFDGRIAIAAFWIVMGILLKFYPFLLVPLFMVEKCHVRLKFAACVGLFFLVGMAAAWAVWGAAVLDPFKMAAVRGASFLSIFIPLKAIDDVLTGGAIVGPLIRYNGLLVVLVAVVSALVCWKRGFAWLSAMVIVVMACLLTYKVGHQQFFMAWSVAIACLPLLKTEEGDRLALATMPYLLFLSAFSHVALWPYVAFPIAIMTMVAMFRVRSMPERTGTADPVPAIRIGW
jgi:hypothetical protein